MSNTKQQIWLAQTGYESIFSVSTPVYILKARNILRVKDRIIFGHILQQWILWSRFSIVSSKITKSWITLCSVNQRKPSFVAFVCSSHSGHIDMHVRVIWWQSSLMRQDWKSSLSTAPLLFCWVGESLAMPLCSFVVVRISVIRKPTVYTHELHPSKDNSRSEYLLLRTIWKPWLVDWQPWLYFSPFYSRAWYSKCKC